MGVVKCNVSMAQITDSYGCIPGLKGAARRRFGTNKENPHASLRSSHPYKLFICTYLQPHCRYGVNFKAYLDGPWSKP
jgi:hypothetical protein